jgi:glycosyltransferase involved in cell wall biosynthesis
MVERLIVIHGDRGHIVDGIRDHTERICRALAAGEVRVTALRVQTGGPGARRFGRSLPIWRRLRGQRRSTVAVIQYSPFCYGRRGFAPWLPAYLLAMRAGGRGPGVALMVHEPHVPMTSWRWTLMGLWQRFQLAALRRSSDVVLTSIEPWARSLAPRRPRRRTRHLPVGSNLPDARHRRGAERERLGIGDGTLLVSCLGRDHQSWLGAYVVDAVNALARSGRTVVLLNLGADTLRLDGIDPSVEVRMPGFLEGEALAAKLAASDLFLAPLSDGVSTRRGSLMAALQHGLPVVGTVGPLTDRVLRDASPALRLTAVGDRGRFARAAVAFGEDPDRRRAAGAAARELYEREFDWPVIATRLLAALPERR